MVSCRNLLQELSPRRLSTCDMGALCLKTLILGLQYGVTSPPILASHFLTLALYLTNSSHFLANFTRGLPLLHSIIANCLKQLINTTDIYKIVTSCAVGVRTLIISRTLSIVSSVFITKSNDFILFLMLPPDVCVMYSSVLCKGQSRARHLLQELSPRRLSTCDMGALCLKTLILGLQYGVTSPPILASHFLTLALYLTNFVYSIEFI
jgi:hypothetical protein